MAFSREATFDVDVDIDDAIGFARFSGDWNPLHTDPDYAAKSSYGRQVLHGAFSAGLVSRMAGMFIPGRDCLLHAMQLRFLAPIFPPVQLTVKGRLVSGAEDAGKVDVSVSDKTSGRLYVQASYDFGSHVTAGLTPAASESPEMHAVGHGVILVTGASGGLGSALLRRLADRGRGLSRSGAPGMLSLGDPPSLDASLNGRRVAGIIHAGWPMQDNVRLLKLMDPKQAIEHHISEPIAEALTLARLMATHGENGACLILVGSTAASAGRHAFRTPLYSLAKSMVPTLTQIMAIELAATGHRCASVVYDVLDTGMNKAMSAAQRQMHADRAPSGHLPDADEAAQQILWVFENKSSLLSGAVISLTGGALP